MSGPTKTAEQVQVISLIVAASKGIDLGQDESDFLRAAKICWDNEVEKRVNFNSEVAN